MTLPGNSCPPSTRCYSVSVRAISRHPATPKPSILLCFLPLTLKSTGEAVSGESGRGGHESVSARMHPRNATNSPRIHSHIDTATTPTHPLKHATPPSFEDRNEEPGLRGTVRCVCTLILIITRNRSMRAGGMRTSSPCCFQHHPTHLQISAISSS